MPARKKVGPEDDPTIPSLKEILSEGATSKRDSFASANPVTYARLLHAVCSLGGMVTFWDDRNNGRLCFSMRLGTQKQSYQVETSEELERIIESIVSKFTPSMRSHGVEPPPLLSSYTPPGKPTPSK